ncbi:TonB-dependent receptor [Exilibacterium tricleocarpae]|uniref:TonB-dependent receptor n=1 Tax=Exilibacterium tricleocarpae TaxID=2591008 RepID=A0A545TS97_9GAMM|nr:TonB-dependent receptor [Exilibacterium tricleocarpae]TQV80095.1 TonB-dependent receptor [Exilibacterium tricleocarpae]
MRPQLLAVIAAPLCYSGFLSAQTDNEAEKLSALEEVVVTAQKRETTLQSTPATVAALDGAELASRNAVTLQDLNSLLPNTHVGEEGLRLEFAIRGVSNGSASAGGDASVAVHTDGVYTEGTGALFYDLERVEVIYGPQGTFYGRNATGGAINVISRKPDYKEFAADFSYTRGNYSQDLTRALINAPLIEDTLALRLAVVAEDREGYNINTFDGARENSSDDAERWSARLSLGYQPRHDLSITLRGTFNEVDGVGGGEVPNAHIQVVDPLTGEVLAPLPANLASLTAEQIRQNRDDPRAFPTFFAGKTSLEEYAYNIAVQWQLENMVVNYIGGISNTDAGGGAGARLFSSSQIPSIPKSVTDQYSNELRLTSNTNGDWQWVVGLFQYQSERSSKILVESGNLADILQPISVDIDTRAFDAEATAVFSSVSFQASENLSLRAGARHSRDKKSISQTTTVISDPLLALIFDIPEVLVRLNDNESDFDNFDWMLGSEYQFNADQMLYFSASTGYKAGGLNGSNASSLTFDQEQVLAFELGSKNKFLDGRLILNSALFAYDYEDYQVNTRDPVTLDGIVTNTDGADFSGAEVSWMFSHNQLLLSGGLAYLDANFKNDTVVFDSTLGREVDVSGLRLPKAPRWSATLGAEHTWEAAPLKGSIKLKADLYFEAETYLSFTPLTNLQDERVDVQDSYSRLDLSLGYENAGRDYLIELFVTNVTDEEIMTGYSQVDAGFARFNFSPPKTYGARFNVRL